MLTGPIFPGFAFTWEEALRTEHRSLLATNRTYAEGDPEVQANVLRLARDVLQPLRLHFGAPVQIHSWVRCPALNNAVGGVQHSDHLIGLAADLHVVGVTLDAVWTWIRGSALPFGQAIREPIGAGEAGWVHVSGQRAGGPVRQAIR